jgi:membrane associated rhomboid family serine protease
MYPSVDSAPPPPRPAGIPMPMTKPVFTYVLIGVTCVVYLFQLILGDPFTKLGWKANDLIRQGEYWRLITPIFFHAYPLHILFNMYALYIIGPEVERIMGYARFLLIYFLAGYAGVLTSFAFSPDYSLGASGAIFGLIGALAVFLYRHRQQLGRLGRSMLNNVVFVIILNVLLSFTPGIDLFGHFGGLLAGSITAWLLSPIWRIETDPYTGSNRLIDSNALSSPWWKLALIFLSLGIITIGLLIF